VIYGKKHTLNYKIILQKGVWVLPKMNNFLKKHVAIKRRVFFKKVPTGYACILGGFFASGYTLAMLAFIVFAKTVNQAVPNATSI